MKRYLLVISAILFTFLSISPLAYQKESSLSYKNEPDGFRGIKWGTDISTLKDMEYVKTDPSYGGVKLYKRKNDKLQIGDSELISILYGFWKDKFSSVTIYAKGFKNWIKLKEACFQRYSEGMQAKKTQFYWYGNIATISLGYNEVKELITLLISSEKIFKQQKEYQE